MSYNLFIGRSWPDHDAYERFGFPKLRTGRSGLRANEQSFNLSERLFDWGYPGSGGA